MAKDGLLPERFSAVHPKFETPYITTILTGAAAMVIAGFFPIEILSALGQCAAMLRGYIKIS
jgi:basic amino acid/polyamine antiporter, APA family